MPSIKFSTLVLSQLYKKEFTSFDIALIVHELKETIIASRVNNIYQLNATTLILKLHKKDLPPIRLVLEAGKRLHLTNYALKPPRMPPAFCMAVRKHLRGAWVNGIEQHEFERIVIISFRTKMSEFQLILELFGEGNLILVGGKGEILQALIFKRMRDRNILRNELFQFPPSSGSNPFKITENALKDAVKGFGNIEIVRALARFLGLGGFYAEEILLRAKIEKSKVCSSLSNTEIEVIFGVLENLLSAISCFRIEPKIILSDDGRFLAVAPFNLKHYEGFRSHTYRSFNEAVDEFYLRVTASEKAFASVEVDKKKQEAERLKRIISEQEKALREDEAKAERAKQIGDTIYKHSSEFHTILEKFKEIMRAGKSCNTFISEILATDIDRVRLEKIIESFDARKLTINVCVDTFHFSLKLRRTLFENAAEYYERGKKAKQKTAGVLKALSESRKKLSEIEKKISQAEAQKSEKPAEIMKEFVKRKIKQKKWYEKFRWFRSSEGFLVVAGKDSVSNEVLVKKYTNSTDLVFHAEIAGAPFVVLKIEDKLPSSKTFREASEFAASFSRAWREGVGSADVYWVKPVQLSKSGPSGEYVAHGAFAVTGKRNWMRGVPLQLAIGVVEGPRVTFLGGPLEAVEAKTKVFVTIAPGDLTGKKLLNQILQTLKSKLPKEQREKLDKVSIEQIREFVPYTKGRLTKTVK